MANARLGVSAARMGASSRAKPSVAIETKRHFISQMMAKRAPRERARTDAELQRAWIEDRKRLAGGRHYAEDGN